MNAQERAEKVADEIWQQEVSDNNLLPPDGKRTRIAAIIRCELNLAELERVAEVAKVVSDANCIDVLAHGPEAMKLLQALNALELSRK